jgi:lipopolysaccharide export system permease protein
MKIISRYIVFSFLKLMGLCVSSFVAIYLVIDFLEKIGKFTRAHGKIHHIFLYFLYKIPEITIQVTPLAVLMATLLTLGMLSRHSEITAMRGCGISLMRITLPVLVTALAVSLLSFLVAEFIVPSTSSKTLYLEEVKIGQKNPGIFFRQQNIWFREGNTILQARTFTPAALTLRGITIWQMAPGMKPVQRIDADTGKFTKSGWLLNGVVIRNIGAGNAVHTEKRQELPITLQLGLNDLKVLEKEADTMGFFALIRYCDRLSKGGYDQTRYLAKLHSRISLPFASLVMAFLGIPFALRGGRTSGIAMGIGISLGIGFGYFAINATLLSFGQAGALPPLVSAWAANFIFAAIGVWLAMTVNR